MLDSLHHWMIGLSTFGSFTRPNINIKRMAQKRFRKGIVLLHPAGFHSMPTSMPISYYETFTYTIFRGVIVGPRQHGSNHRGY